MAVLEPVPRIEDISAPPHGRFNGARLPTGVVITPLAMLPAAYENVVPCITTAALPNGTLVEGDATRLMNAPEVPTVTAGCAVATPPIVMLFGAIVPAVKPCASMTRDVGAEPMKLKVVTPPMEL
jgi:hypothetical protein